MKSIENQMENATMNDENQVSSISTISDSTNFDLVLGLTVLSYKFKEARYFFVGKLFLLLLTECLQKRAAIYIYKSLKFYTLNFDPLLRMQTTVDWH